MFALLLSFALCLPLPVAGIIAPDPTATTIKRIDLRRAPQPTHRANLLARDGYVKNCGFVNGNLGNLFALGLFIASRSLGCQHCLAGLPLDCLPGYDCTHDGIVCKMPVRTISRGPCCEQRHILRRSRSRPTRASFAPSNTSSLAIVCLLHMPRANS